MARRTARPSTPPALAALLNPGSTVEQIGALKQLKNDLIGHEQRKHLVLLRGVVEPLARALASGSPSSKAGGKKRSAEVNGYGRTSSSNKKASASRVSIHGWGDEDEMRLQATLVVGSLAHGGRDFAEILLQDSIIAPLLSGLSRSENPPRIVLATLQALLAAATSTSVDEEYLIPGLESRTQSALVDHLYSTSVLECFADILTQRSTEKLICQQISVLAQLILQTCRTNHLRDSLLKAGILDLLSTRLASTIVPLGYTLSHTEDSYSTNLPPALPKSMLGCLLDAVAAIVKGSHYRQSRFLYSPDIASIFPPNTTAEVLMVVNHDNAVGQLPQSTTTVERILPQIQSVQGRGDNAFSKAFPALGSISGTGEYTRMPNFTEPQTSSPKMVTGEDFESPLCVWLISMTRAEQGTLRLRAALLLALLIQGLRESTRESWAENGHKNRDRVLAFLVVPVLVKMVDESSAALKERSSTMTREEAQTKRDIVQQAPMALALLIGESPALQKATFDAGAIPVICQILKRSFDPLPPSSPPEWSSDPDWPARPREPLTQDHLHALRCRAGALQALAAIAYREDLYRKRIIEHGAVQCIHDSLFPRYQDRPAENGTTAFSNTNTATPRALDNPPAVLIAACLAARAMSRSVSVLRTSLMDAKIAIPVARLLRHHDLDVQIAATDVLCNLLLQFSPMKDGLIEEGVLGALCEQAHSSNLHLRLGSIWALKHLVLNASNDTKISCLKQLGPGWLLQTVIGSESATIGMGTSNAAGEQVDLLNAAADEPAMDVDETGSDLDDDISSAARMGVTRTRRPLSPRISNRLRMIKESERNPAITAQKFDVRIQEQALQLIRNMIGEADTATEMNDHLLNTFGINRFFEVIGCKIRPKGMSPPLNRRSAPSPGPTSTITTSTSNFWDQAPKATLSSHAPLPPGEILTSVVLVLVHLANGNPSHRSLLVSQTDLLKSVVPLFQHQSSGLRVACLWLVNNLTWVDDSTDMAGARLRAAELRRLGFEAPVRACTSDTELDARERAKTAVEQLNQLLQGEPDASALGGSAADGRSVGGVGKRDGLGHGVMAGSAHRAWER